MNNILFIDTCPDVNQVPLDRNLFIFPEFMPPMASPLPPRTDSVSESTNTFAFLGNYSTFVYSLSLSRRRSRLGAWCWLSGCTPVSSSTPKSPCPALRSSPWFHAMVSPSFLLPRWPLGCTRRRQNWWRRRDDREGMGGMRGLGKWWGRHILSRFGSDRPTLLIRWRLWCISISVWRRRFRWFCYRSLWNRKWGGDKVWLG